MTQLRLRPPAVAGTFYPASERGLRDALDQAFAGARIVADRTDAGAAPPPKALIAPHAGYVYSGAVAATGYKALRGLRGVVERVVLLGPAHRVWLDGIAVPTVDAFETPLGPVAVDAAGRDAVLRHPAVVAADAPHAPEHSLEVHLPFIVETLGRVKVLPLVVGAASAADVAAVIELVWGGEETLIVVSTDLSHYHDHATARRLDAATAEAIVAGDGTRLDDRAACGAYPLRGFLLAARRHGLRVSLLDLRTSGDTAGSRDRVVGYGAFVAC